MHHHAIRADTDSNYSTVLSCWDRLFRSRSGNQRTQGMPIGVEHAGERPLTGLLVAPFAGQAGTNASPRSVRQ